MRMNRRNQAGGAMAGLRHQRGITLVELMIVLAVVAILASLAVPSYRDYVLRTKRTEGMNAMLNLAACQERAYIKLNRYALDRCGLTDSCLFSSNQEYQICMALNRNNAIAANQSFTLTATPQGAQANDSCGNLTLTETGVRGTSVGATDQLIDDCWKGRKVAAGG